MHRYIKENLLLGAWTLALLSMAGSLYFSEIVHYPPCVLCWWQRIFLYPLVFLIPIGIYKKDRNISAYVWPLSLIAMLFGIYHNLLYYHVLPEAAAPCALGVSCTTEYVEYFGFIGIPLLALMASTGITVLALMHRKISSDV